MDKRLTVVLLFIILLPAGSFGMLKQQYGGNIKISDNLTTVFRAQPLFQIQDGHLTPMTTLPFSLEEKSARIDLSDLDPDQIIDIEKWIVSLNETGNACHWILDYPYYNHQHPTILRVDNSQLLISTSNPDNLRVVLTSSCLLPSGLKSLAPFQRTQFGYEANINCLSGRPFLDSVSAVQVDDTNPYLAIKLNDVDVTQIPEDRFSQISADNAVRVINGPSDYVYLLTSGMSPEQAQSLAALIDLPEISAAVLNNHSEIVFSQGNAAPVKAAPIFFSYPQEDPYRLIAERLRVQWQNKGVTFSSQAKTGMPQVTLDVERIQDQNADAYRYRLLGRHLSTRPSDAWFDVWRRAEVSRMLIPLLIHHTSIAVRKSIQDLRTDPAGMPDFPNCWLLQ